MSFSSDTGVAAQVIDVTTANVQTEVLEASREQPVLLLFWAEPDPQSADTRAAAERLVARYPGKFRLAALDISREQMLGQQLAQQLMVQALPAVRFILDGRMLEQAEGPMDEAALEALLGPHLMTGAERLQGSLDAVLEARDFDQAAAMLQAALQEEPRNLQLLADLADVLVRGGRVDDAETVLARLPAEAPERERPAERLAVLQEVTQYPEAAELEGRLADDTDLQARYQLAMRRVAEEDHEGALALLIEILQADRGWEDDLGRRAMLRVFTLLGKGNALATQWRRRMFAFMH